MAFDEASKYDDAYKNRQENQGSALTARETDVTHTAPSTPDYAVQDLTTTTPFGFETKDEGNTVLQVLANVQAVQKEIVQLLIDRGWIPS